ncbi:LysM peptidoglycan-binding domain-containing protein [Psychrobacillus vulpis]|uniref:LysM peptidoglycan-binding domain-containing protein n=1 Tax=Psychrobacillus vulpis TaxID=2325572 RepID=A0A544TVE3_9BACI|nr:LysM peptidoglycan-binding domain-containing protein [Psychrobacillus vulpis]TQR21401.1 LysM peptidoglycan-binding domain-containing protein [Psychrobacillus vulpis]
MQIFYTVRPGDTLYQIAKRWELPVESVIAANNLEAPYTIYVGQQLSVPPGVDVIRVRPGDTVFEIAQFFGVPQSVIIEANQLFPPFIIQSGQLLKVPPGNPYYVVQPGDTLFQIASRYNVITNEQSKPELIREVNNLPSNTIFPGMRLLIPYALPGGRGLIAYVSSVGGIYDLSLYNPTNGDNRKITNGLGESFSIPFWSPDSNKIAFVGKSEILYVLHLMEGTITRIDQFSEGLGIYISWSQDSQQIAYTKQNDIILYNLNTHQVKKINQPGSTDVQWFPSGAELLFQAPDASGISQLYRIRTDGTNKKQITRNDGGLLNNVRLSPDGSYALYTTPGASISIIFTLEISTGRTFEVRGGPLAKNYFPVWSPNSSTIAYSATAFEDVGYFSLIRITERTGENDLTKAISNCFATPATWSPEGRKIAYLSGCYNQGMASEMWLIDLTHPVPVRLLEGSFITSLQWSPMPIPPRKKTYTSLVYKVQFQYPAHWEKVTNERFEGPDGFFQVSAISSEETINEVCHNEAFHQLLPYGSEPRIHKVQIQQQEACIIFPSDDQPSEMREQSALIVKYPKLIQIEGITYNYFILWVDQDHMNKISSTIIFL